MIVVTGATGKLGKLVVKHLLNRIPPNQIGVSVRDVTKAADLSAKGIRVRQGDFDHPESLRHAFEGADKVLIVSVDNLTDASRQHAAAIDAAKDAGVNMIYYTSHVGSDPQSHFIAMQHHAETEENLRRSGVNFVALRNGFYNESLPMMLGAPIQTGKIIAPADGKVSFTSHEDLAEGTAIILTDDSKITGPYLNLTAKEAVDFEGIAQYISEVTGSPVQREVVSDELYIQNLAPYGLPEFFIQYYLASRVGAFDKVDPLLEELLGRAPESMLQWAKRVYVTQE